MNLWQPALTLTEGAITGVSFGISADGGAALLNRELGIAAEKYRNDKIVNGLKDPSDLLTKYDTAVETKTNAAGATFKADMEALISVGLSEDRAKAIALKKNGDWLQNEIAILKLQHPLASDLNTLASATAKVPLNIDGRDSAVDSDKYRAYYEKRKAKKAAKRKNKA